MNESNSISTATPVCHSSTGSAYKTHVLIFLCFHSCLHTSAHSAGLLWIMAWCVININAHPAHLLPRLLLTQAPSALASSVPPPSGCPVAPPTCATTSAHTITTTTENHPCHLAVCHARLACLVCSRRCCPPQGGLFHLFLESPNSFWLKNLFFSSATFGSLNLSLIFWFWENLTIFCWSWLPYSLFVMCAWRGHWFDGGEMSCAANAEHAALQRGLQYVVAINNQCSFRLACSLTDHTAGWVGVDVLKCHCSLCACWFAV